MENVRYLQEENNKSTATIVAQIFENVQKLISQEIALGKAELRAEYTKLKSMFALMLALGVASGFALVLATLSVIHLLAAAGIADWAVYGIVALIYAAAAVACYFASRKVAQPEQQLTVGGERYAA